MSHLRFWRGRRARCPTTATGELARERALQSCRRAQSGAHSGGTDPPRTPLSICIPDCSLISGVSRPTSPDGADVTACHQTANPPAPSDVATAAKGTRPGRELPALVGCPPNLAGVGEPEVQFRRACPGEPDTAKVSPGRSTTSPALAQVGSPAPARRCGRAWASQLQAPGPNPPRPHLTTATHRTLRRTCSPPLQRYDKMSPSLSGCLGPRTTSSSWGAAKARARVNRSRGGLQTRPAPAAAPSSFALRKLPVP